MKKTLISLAISLGLIVPAIALAQTATTGLLTVYVMVLNQSGYSAFQTYAPGNFTVNVSGSNPSIASFQGSQSGTPVQIYPGSYAVTVASLAGYTPTYSVGCTNTIAANQSQTCVVTMTPTYGYTSYPYGVMPAYNYTNGYYNYPWGWNVPALTCQAQTQSVMVGQPATFVAQGGAGGTYNWLAPYSQSLNYPNAGTQVTVVFQSAGQQTVTVTNGSQTASCSVLVTQGFYPYGTYPYSTYPYSYTTPSTGPVYTTPAAYLTTYPQLPKTGFGPHDAALGVALSLVLLIAAGIVAAPYARKTLTTISR
jgi:hypothetical protein